MSQDAASELLRLQRLIGACRHGLTHDLTNKLVALRGLIQLLEQDEAAHLSSDGREYLSQLTGVGDTTLTLVRHLRRLADLVSPPPSEIIALPELVEDAVGQLSPVPACRCDWESPRVFAPRPLVQQALTQVLQLLTELDPERAQSLEIHSRPSDSAIELTLRAGLADETPEQLPPPLHPAPALPSVWLQRLDCVLLAQCAAAWGGDVRWYIDNSGAAVCLTLPAPR
jgi:signal transduction histidine kinase